MISLSSPHILDSVDTFIYPSADHGQSSSCMHDGLGDLNHSRTHPSRPLQERLTDPDKPALPIRIHEEEQLEILHSTTVLTKARNLPTHNVLCLKSKFKQRLNKKCLTCMIVDEVLISPARKPIMNMQIIPKDQNKYASFYPLDNARCG